MCLAATTLGELLKKIEEGADFKGWVSLEKVKAIASKFGIEGEQEVQDMLVLFHQLGSIFYVNSSETLRKIVTTDVSWLITAIGKVVRDLTLHKFNVTDLTTRKLETEVDLMFTKGLISYDLLEYLWGKEEEIAFLVEFMEKTMLLNTWKWKMDVATFREQELFLVPSLIIADEPEIEKAKDELAMKENYRAVFSFSETFLPEGIYERLICLVVSEASRNEASQPPELQKDICKVHLGKENSFYLYREGDSIVCAVLHGGSAAYDLVLVDKMLLKIKNDLSLERFAWKVSLEDPSGGEKGFIEFKEAKKKNLNPWFDSKEENQRLFQGLTANVGLNLDSFLDGM